MSRHCESDDAELPRLEGGIGAEDRQLFHHRLRDQQPLLLTAPLIILFEISILVIRALRR